MAGGNLQLVRHAINAVVNRQVDPVIADIFHQIGVLFSNVGGQIRPRAGLCILHPHAVIAQHQIGHVVGRDVQSQLLSEVGRIALNQVDVDAEMIFEVFPRQLGRVVHGTGSCVENIQSDYVVLSKSTHGYRRAAAKQYQRQDEGQDSFHVWDSSYIIFLHMAAPWKIHFYPFREPTMTPLTKYF